MEKGINARHLLIIALGYKDYIRDEINKIYNERRWEYYEEFKKSGFYDDIVIKSFTTQKEDSMRKVAGIVQWGYEHGDSSIIKHLIKKGYKNVVRYYEQNKNKLDFKEFTMYILKRSNKEIFEVSELEMTMNHSILLYLAHLDRVNIVPIFQTAYGEIVFKGINHLFIDAAHGFMVENNKFDEEEIEKANKFITETIGLQVDKKHPSVVSNIFDYMIDLDVEKEASSRILSSEYEISGIRELVFEKELLKHVGAYTTILKLSGLNYGDLLNVEIPDEILVSLAHNAIMREKGNAFSDMEVKEFFIASLYMYATLEQYKSQKGVLLNDFTEAWHIDVKNRERKLNESVNSQEKLKERLEQQINEELQKRENVEAKVRALEKENAKLKSELVQQLEDKNELVELKNFVYKQTKADLNYDEKNVEQAIENLNKYKIVICAGHPNMIRKLKENMPTIESISTETLGKSFAYLRNYDIVYFYPNYANHSFYKKIKESIRNSNARFVYLPDVDNTERIILEMNESI